jgi:lysophospholipase L1-like esterase
MISRLRLIVLSFFLAAQAPAQSTLFGTRLEGGTQAKRLLVFGDTLSSVDALPKNQQADIWPSLLETRAQGWLSVINESKPARSTSAITDLEAVLKKKRDTPPDLIVIMLGTMDTRDPSPQCVPRAVNNLRGMVSAVRRKLGPQFPVLLIAPPNLCQSSLPPGGATPEQRAASLKAMADAYAKLAEETKCAFASTHGVIPEEHFAKGGLLPDENGHIALVETLLPSVLHAAGFQEISKSQ